MQKKIKVALVFDGLSLPPKDGITYRAYNLMKKLSAREDLEVHVYFADRGWTSLDNIKAEGFKGWMFPANWLTEKPQKIADMMIADGIDIIHVCNSHDVVPFFGFELSQMTGARLVCEMHDINHKLSRGLGKNEAEIERERAVQEVVGACCDHVFVMSSLDLQDIRQMDIPPEKLTHAPNGVDVYDGNIPTDKKKTVIFVGNMSYEPNREAAERIIHDIAPTVAARHPDVEFLFIGRTPDELKQYESRHIRFLGEVDDLTPYLTTSMVGVAPLLNGSGMKVKMLTYSSHALPVVGTPVALMGYEKNDGFVILDEISDIAKQLSDFLDNPEELSRRGEAGRSYVREKFGWQPIVDNIVVQYKKIMRSEHERANWSIERGGHDVIINGVHCSEPLFRKEERFNKDIPKYERPIKIDPSRPQRRRAPAPFKPKV